MNIVRVVRDRFRGLVELELKMEAILSLIYAD